MGRILFLSFIFLSLLIKSNGQNTWVQKANFPSINLIGTFSFSIGSKGYVGGGFDTIYGASDKFWEYDPFLDTWTQKANFAGGARVYAAALSLLGKGYVGLGSDSTETILPNDWWQYDPILDMWTQKSNFNGGSKLLPVAISIGNKGYVALGNDASFSCTNDLWEYDPISDSWTQKANLPSTARGDAIGFTIGNKGYFGAGFFSSSPYTLVDFWEYDPSVNSWTQMANLPDSSRFDASAFSICGKGYVGIGEDYNGPYGYSDSFIEYDPVLNQWSQKADFPGIGRDEGACFSIGNKGYIGLGSRDGSTACNDFYEYTGSCKAGISELSDIHLALLVSPNPFAFETTLHSSANLVNATLTIYNSFGQEVKQIKNLSGQTAVLRRDNLLSGLYFIYLAQENKVIGKSKLIVVD